jgi:ABC-type microcin C transport system duplicated ATPase subunit YejF
MTASYRGSDTGTAPIESQPVLQVRGVTKQFPVRTGIFGRKEFHTAVDNVSLSVQSGKTLAVVGESGSGKTTLGLMVLDLLQPTSGEILYRGQPFSSRSGSNKRALRREMQVVFQDPYASLNARLTVREALTEGMIIHRIGNSAKEREDRALDLLQHVSLPPETLDRYPHEFSGGQRQRIAIARALSVEPGFILLDEPTSALDVSVQSQVLNLLLKLQREFNLTYLFISHNLEVVSYLADEVAVMERGRIVEQGPVDDIFDRPTQEYTHRLLAAIPRIGSSL